MLLTKFKTIIAEDDDDTRAYLKDLLSRIDNIELVGEVSNGRDLIELAKAMEPDLLLVDIEMPEVDGMKAVNAILDEGYNPYIVFLTGYNEFALDAFDLCAVDYIVKPVRFDRLKKTFEKINSFQKRQEEKPSEIKGVLTAKDKIFIKTGTALTFIDVDSIVMIEREKNKTVIYCKDNRYETYDTLNSLEEKLKFPEFFRSHRSFIVNLRYITQITPIGNRTYEVLFQQTSNSALLSRAKADKIFSLLNVPY
ncbi:MAG: LytTR family DNA-binding domain-containing protein [Clostridia bacterium]|nr:LytTR family DNA-binding domain-containing protein [Clostridia bacterium]